MKAQTEMWKLRWTDLKRHKTTSKSFKKNASQIQLNNEGQKREENKDSKLRQDRTA